MDKANHYKIYRLNEYKMKGDFVQIKSQFQNYFKISWFCFPTRTCIYLESKPLKGLFLYHEEF